MELTHHVTMLSAAGAFTLAWIAYFRWKSRALPSRAVVIGVAALLGVGSISGALGAFAGLERLGADPQWEAMRGGSASAAIATALAIGATEEGAKLLPVLALALFRHITRPLDGVIFAVTAGVGFSWSETLVLCMSGELDVASALARAATAPLTHALFAAPAGAGAALAVLHRRALLLPLGFSVAVAVHGAYDVLLANRMEPAAAALVLALWLWFMHMAVRWSRWRWTEEAGPPSVTRQVTRGCRREPCDGL